MKITLITGRFEGQQIEVEYESDTVIRGKLPDGSTIVVPKKSKLGIKYYVEGES